MCAFFFPLFYFSFHPLYLFRPSSVSFFFSRPFEFDGTALGLLEREIPDACTGPPSEKPGSHILVLCSFHLVTKFKFKIDSL